MLNHDVWAQQLFRRLTRQVLLGGLLFTGAVGGLGVALATDPGSDATFLMQRQGLQKQQLMQGQAATQLSHSQAKKLTQTAPAASAPTPTSAPSPVLAPKLVTEADVKLQREERIRRLNAAKVGPANAP